MHSYTTGQWILLFFFYCFLGWVWESCFVSAKQHRWVNRGFLTGPLLPIYGSGAIIILLATIPVAESSVLVFLLGMAAATALEYVTGAVMEKLFKVRYWDYSQQPFNVNGYICLGCSIAWGFFSLAMVWFIHPPVARLLCRIPAWCVDPLAVLLTVLFTVDVVRSVQAAMDFREVLTRLTEENEDLRRLARRAEVFAAFAEEDLKRFRERTEVEKLLLQQRIQTNLQEKRVERVRRTQQRQAQLEDALREVTTAKLHALETIEEELEKCRARLDQATDLGQELVETHRQELRDALDTLHDRQHRIREKSARTYQRALRILRGNPSVRTKDFSEALSAIKRLDKDPK